MSLLNEVLRRPTIISGWGASDWNRMLPLARRAGLLGRCHSLFAEHGVDSQVPERIRDQFIGALMQTRYVQCQARRELRHVAACLTREDIPVMALKGLAYLVAELPPSGWRNLSDIDLMVRAEDVARADRALRDSGWVDSGEHDAYDDRYYRDWMHEVPPLIHPRRSMEVDLHHNLSPPVSRIRIDADKLWQRAQQHVDPCGQRIHVLDGVDMLLHNAVHLFMNDELRGGLRDVVDFRDLYQHFSTVEKGFDERLLARADELGCGRALYYVAAAAARFAGLQLASEFERALAAFAPNPPVAALMGALSASVFATGRPGAWRNTAAVQALFVRSHWIRMPPLMLVRHLARKAFISRRSQVSAGDLPG